MNLRDMEQRIINVTTFEGRCPNMRKALRDMNIYDVLVLSKHHTNKNSLLVLAAETRDMQHVVRDIGDTIKVWRVV